MNRKSYRKEIQYERQQVKEHEKHRQRTGTGAESTCQGCAESKYTEPEEVIFRRWIEPVGRLWQSGELDLAGAA